MVRRRGGNTCCFTERGGRQGGEWKVVIVGIIFLVLML